MKSYSSRELIKMAKENGWFFVSAEGDHHHFKHPSIKGKITIPHPVKDFKPKTLATILKQIKQK